MLLRGASTATHCPAPLLSGTLRWLPGSLRASETAPALPPAVAKAHVLLLAPHNTRCLRKPAQHARASHRAAQTLEEAPRHPRQTCQWNRAWRQRAGCCLKKAKGGIASPMQRVPGPQVSVSGMWVACLYRGRGTLTPAQISRPAWSSLECSSLVMYSDSGGHGATKCRLPRISQKGGVLGFLAPTLQASLGVLWCLTSTTDCEDPGGPR